MICSQLNLHICCRIGHRNVNVPKNCSEAKILMRKQIKSGKCSTWFLTKPHTFTHTHLIILHKEKKMTAKESKTTRKAAVVTNKHLRCSSSFRKSPFFTFLRNISYIQNIRICPADNIQYKSTFAITSLLKQKDWYREGGMYTSMQNNQESQLLWNRPKHEGGSSASFIKSVWASQHRRGKKAHCAPTSMPSYTILPHLYKKAGEVDDG